MNIHAEEGEPLVFRLLDSENEVYNAYGQASFSACTQLGTVQKPYVLWFASQDILDEIKPTIASSSKVRTIQYFNLSGQMISKPEQGICIRKVIYEDGSVKTTKLYR